MLRFKEYLNEMAARSRPRAQKLLNYVARKQNAPTSPYSSTSQTKTDTQLTNLVPNINDMNLIFRHPDNPKQKVSYDTAQEEGKLKKVPIRKIVTSQETIQKEVVAKKIQGKWKGHYPEHPLMAHIDSPGHPLHDHYYLFDGNHRVNAAKLQGKTHITGRVMKVNLQRKD